MSLTVNAKDLRLALDAVWHGVASDESRPILQTIAFEQREGSLRLVAADNYRLVLYDIASASDGSITFERPTPVRRDDLAGLRATLKGWRSEGVVIDTAEAERVRFTGPGVVVVRVADGTFPAYGQAVPDPAAPVVAVNPRYLAEAAAAAKGAGVLGITLEIRDPLAPLVIRSRETRHVEVIMPIRDTFPGGAA